MQRISNIWRHSAYFFLLLVLMVVACRPQKLPQPLELGRDPHLTLGNPSRATTVVQQPNNYLIERPEYALAYHRDRGTPNWVCWHLSRAWIGEADRQDNFRIDDSLPEGWYRVRPTDYRNSGFDRGHLCPSADRSATEAENAATFLMTNMAPQAPNHNRIVWNALEQYCRQLIDEGMEMYIIAGVHGQGGEGSNGSAQALADGQVIVPATFWKIIVVLPEGEDDLRRINTDTRVIAVNIPNTQAASQQRWENYRVSVRELEALTGYDFLSSLPSRLQDQLETRIDHLPIR
ncbi:DNA/RNA non-specific endonuclease [Eisenibacter elegans]|uniref:DNA/RNA non-specific endonuclease n=1 Tax=Eisenibacter elegans TaxID=997 RepID=UPI0006885D90|nr:DNA/RNA non-specific endonuclease [Eisenibacter elegans]